MTETLLTEMGWEALANIRLKHLEKVNRENDRLRAALKITTEKLITSWSRCNLAPDDELELVKTNTVLLKD